MDLDGCDAGSGRVLDYGLLMQGKHASNAGFRFSAAVHNVARNSRSFDAQARDS